jgi:hypothetical protein
MDQTQAGIVATTTEKRPDGLLMANQHQAGARMLIEEAERRRHRH